MNAKGLDLADAVLAGSLRGSKVSTPTLILSGLAGTGGRPIADYFDLIAGTSTGGILALGLGAGYSARELLELYTIRGCEVLPNCGPVSVSP
jgi:patatin-like phospholipase/acyl hydrolase